MQFPAFGESEFFDCRENRNARVITLPGSERAKFDAYCDLLQSEGFSLKEIRSDSIRSFGAFSREEEGVFLNYYENTGELTIVEEVDCRYFTYRDTNLDASANPQITQISLEDFGLSYVIRLSDGRFIVIDGGWNFEPDQEKLFRCLSEGAAEQIPVIAAWILTHPHSDHYHCFIGFLDRYGDRVQVEKVLLNFPEAEDLEHYPAFAKADPRVDYDSSEAKNIPLMWDRIARCGAEVYTPHTGQRYRIGDADCEILSCMDDTLCRSYGINAGSLVVRMELAGQVILWTADTSFSIARIPERYGAYLKADILQVPHHGFQSGDAAGEISGYDLIQPKICFLPVSDYNAYTVFCAYREGTRHLMTNVGIEEMITGSVQRTVSLPYTPPAYAKADLARKFAEGQAAAGARTWIFGNLSTGREADFRFTFLNTTHIKANVGIELFFEDGSRKIRNIRALIPPTRMQTLNIIGEEVESETVWFRWLTLKTQGIPENVPFTVRFISDIPIVISHPDHREIYRT